VFMSFILYIMFSHLRRTTVKTARYQSDLADSGCDTSGKSGASDQGVSSVAFGPMRVRKKESTAGTHTAVPSMRHV